MIKLRLTASPLDPQQRLSHILGLVLRDMRERRKLSTTVQIEVSGDKDPLKFRITYVGTSRPRKVARRPR
jgi:hypothetical protein